VPEYHEIAVRRQDAQFALTVRFVGWTMHITMRQRV
jgi:hypothetical protein